MFTVLPLNRFVPETVTVPATFTVPPLKIRLPVSVTVEPLLKLKVPAETCSAAVPAVTDIAPALAPPPAKFSVPEPMDTVPELVRASAM